MSRKEWKAICDACCFCDTFFRFPPVVQLQTGHAVSSISDTHTPFTLDYLLKAPLLLCVLDPSLSQGSKWQQFHIRMWWQQCLQTLCCSTGSVGSLLKDEMDLPQPRQTESPLCYLPLILSPEMLSASTCESWFSEEIRGCESLAISSQRSKSSVKEAGCWHYNILNANYQKSSFQIFSLLRYHCSNQAEVG